MITIKADIEHSRKINNKDKFYIVKGFFNGGFGWVGWIEKSFVKEQFYKKIPKNISFKIIEVIEFTDKSEYELYKINN